jgi:hypothetical protein
MQSTFPNTTFSPAPLAAVIANVAPLLTIARAYGIYDIKGRTDLCPTEGLLTYRVNMSAVRSEISRLEKGDIVFGLRDNTIHEVGFIVHNNYDDLFEDEIGETHWARIDTLKLDQPVKILESIRISYVTEMAAAALQAHPEKTVSEYLCAITPLLGKAIWDLVNDQVAPVFQGLAPEELIRDFLDRRALHLLQARAELSNFQKSQMLDAFYRRGVFRAALEQRGPVCPFTAETDPEKLEICFIKPWRLASDAEKIDPNNAIWVHYLLVEEFESGVLALEPDGVFQVSAQVNYWACFNGSVLPAADEVIPVHFSREQSKYLDYHMKNIFMNYS